jgi:hypothetical protein
MQEPSSAAGACPTRTPATSVMQFSGPGGNTPGARPRSRARGRAESAPSILATARTLVIHSRSSRRLISSTVGRKPGKVQYALDGALTALLSRKIRLFQFERAGNRCATRFRRPLSACYGEAIETVNIADDSTIPQNRRALEKPPIKQTVPAKIRASRAARPRCPANFPNRRFTGGILRGG